MMSFRAGVLATVLGAGAAIALTVVVLRELPVNRPEARAGAAAADAGNWVVPQRLELSKQDVRNIAKLFSDEEEPVGKPAAIVATELRLRLVGTIDGGDPFSGIATIEEMDKGKTASFRPGDVIQGEVVLVSVLRNQAVIRNGDKLETLRVAPRDDKVARPRVREQEKAAATPVATTATEGMEIKGNETKVTSQLFEHMLEPDGMRELLTGVLAQPEKGDGYKLSRIKQGSIYEKLGIEDGDVVTEVNGLALGDPGRDIGFLKTLREEKSFTLKLRRGDAVVVKTIQVL